MKKIVAVHLLNDRSGSPFVFRQALQALQTQAYQISLYTATPSGAGFLSNMEGVKYHDIQYTHSANKWKTLLQFIQVQWMLFWKLLFVLKGDEIVYVNTLLPAGAALAARLKGCKVMYHVHEVSISPAPLRWILVKIAQSTAHEVIFVSHFLSSQFRFKKHKTRVVHNALDAGFLGKAYAMPAPNSHPTFTVLMLCSLKAYKGVYSFLEVAERLPQVQFEMVLNTDENSLQTWKSEVTIPANCILHSSSNNTLPFFKRAHLVVNLSHPDKWIETFGLTLLEGMACGRPVIAPPVGGPTELVTHGKEGFCIDARQTDDIVAAIGSLRSDFRSYVRLSENARIKAASFSPEVFAADIIQVFEEMFDTPALPPFGKPFPNVESTVL
jgi:glycosyltransferase involved in cell wall biosynthesis